MNAPRVVVYPMDVERDGRPIRIAVVRLPGGELRCLDCDACAPWEGELSPAELALAWAGIERELEEDVMRPMVGSRLLSRILDDLEEHSGERLPVHADELCTRLGVGAEELGATLDQLEAAGWIRRDAFAPGLIWLAPDERAAEREGESTQRIERCALAGVTS
ncbi:hypothetical protein [Sorangium sp. So ce1151]|uniref:DprA-like winged helix domain-containing protein n=1 Tax=Sorangium sp. So ce1151 TaxID=3133332 RepID=UPI003F62DFE0